MFIDANSKIDVRRMDIMNLDLFIIKFDIDILIHTHIHTLCSKPELSLLILTVLYYTMNLYTVSKLW